MDEKILYHFKRLQKAQSRKEKEDRSRTYYHAQGRDLALNTWDRGEYRSTPAQKQRSQNHIRSVEKGPSERQEVNEGFKREGCTRDSAKAPSYQEQESVDTQQLEEAQEEKGEDLRQQKEAQAYIAAEEARQRQEAEEFLRQQDVLAYLAAQEARQAEELRRQHTAMAEEARQRQEAEKLCQQQAAMAAEVTRQAEELHRQQEAMAEEEARKKWEEVELRRLREEEQNRRAEETAYQRAAAEEIRQREARSKTQREDQQQQQRKDGSAQWWAAGGEARSAYWWGQKGVSPLNEENGERCSQQDSPKGEENRRRREHRNHQSNSPYSNTRGRDTKKNARLAEAIEAGKNVVTQYVLRWEKLCLPKESMTRIWSFRDVPWPVLQTPSQPADITRAQVENFFLAPDIYGNVDSRTQVQVLRREMRNWHPDRFNSTVLPLVYEDQLPLIMEGSLVVSGILIELFKKIQKQT